MSFFPLVLLSLLGGEQVIDDFQYATPEAASEAWVANSGTPPVRLIRDEGRSAVEVASPFATQPALVRAVVDRTVDLDLAEPGEFALEIACDSPAAAGQVSLYFRSGGGWYAGSATLGRRAWQTLHFSKASFRIEGDPAGWDKIDGIRIAAWRGRAEDTLLKLRRLTALSHDVALVIPSKATLADQGELRTALDTADGLSAMLADLGLGADAVDEVAITHGALGKRRVAILAYNPRLRDDAATALVQFVEAGGKLLVCYQLPVRLESVLGFGNPKYYRPAEPGGLAEIRFDAADIPGLPAKVRQASWNITTAEPAGHNARVIGRWFDEKGTPTDRAAMLLSDRGAFFSHIVLDDDPAGKRQMLAAILGRLSPPLWQQMAAAALERAAAVGHCIDVPALAAYVKSQQNAAALKCLAAGIDVHAQAEKSAAVGKYPEAVETARKCHDLLVEAYLRAEPSPTREGRAVWNHSGTGAYAGDWDRSAKELGDAGFNMILPNMLWGGLAHYASDVLPRSATYQQYGDQIEQCVAAAHKHGLEVHVWKVNYNLSTAPKSFVERMRSERRLQVTNQGETHDWLCPSHPENQRLELESMLEVARKYPVDGLHFDYIRYPGRETCYCDGCRGRFEAASGRPVADWPRDCYSGSRREEYNDWRCRQITQLVKAVHDEAKRLRPELKISAAVFGSYPSCRESVAQDWPEWIKAGYLDFVCPMDYTESDAFFAGLVENQMKLVAGRIPIYPGIGATASSSGLSADRVVGQIHAARSLGAAGFTIFNFDRGTAGSVIPGGGLGAGKQKATPLHQEVRGGLNRSQQR